MSDESPIRYPEQHNTEEHEGVPQPSNQRNAAASATAGSVRQSNQRTRNWMWTLNNPTEEERRYFSELSSPPRGLQYIIFQEERAPDTGTIHFQGYLEATNTVRLQWLKNNFNPRAHYDVRRGTQEEAIAYCSKEETRVEGGLSKQLGQRRAGATSAAEKKRQRIEALDNIRAKRIKLAEIDSELLLNQAFLSAARHFTSTMLGPHRADLEIVTIVGGTGIGKSYCAYQIGGDSIITYQGNGWFGGADSQGDVLLFDEFTGQIPLHLFLQYLDPYPNQLPVKGGFYPAFYTKVIITSNVKPENWWKKDEEVNEKREGQLAALYRRIGYPGPGLEFPNFDNGHYIEIPEVNENGDKLTVMEQRVMIKQRLLLIGWELE